MQHVLNRLWKVESADIEDSIHRKLILRLDRYDKLGGLKGALDKHGNALMETLGEDWQIVEPLFRSLVSGNSLASAIRRPCRREELMRVCSCSEAQLSHVLALFCADDCNFLRVIGDGLNAIVDIGHESLIRQWEQLLLWFKKEASDASEWQRVVLDVERHGRDGLSGHALKTLLSWWDSSKPTAAWAERYPGNYAQVKDFLDRSQAAERSRAKESAERMAQIVIEVGEIVHSDRFRDLFGADTVRAEILRVLERNQERIEEIHEGTIGAAHRVRTEFRLAATLETLNEATRAVDRYRMAFELGRAALGALPVRGPVNEELLAATIDSAYEYAWFMLDIGEWDSAKDAEEWLAEWVSWETRDTPPALAMPYARAFNLRGRLKSEAGEEKLGRELSCKAVQIVEDAVSQISSAEMPNLESGKLEKLSFLLSQYRYLGDVDKATATVAQMNKLSPGDWRTIFARIRNCQWEAQNQISIARKRFAASNNFDQGRIDFAADMLKARGLLVDAEDECKTLLKLVPQDRGTLLRLADIQADIADSWKPAACAAKNEKDEPLTEGDPERVYECAIESSAAFVKALSGGPILSATTTQFSDLYGQLAELFLCENPASVPALAISFYKDVAEGVGKSLNIFPNSPQLNYVVAASSLAYARSIQDVSERVGMLERAIECFPKTQAMLRPATFSELFSDFAKAYSALIGIHTERGEFNLAEGLLYTMQQTFQPILDRFPWDFYLRVALISTNSRLGQALFKESVLQALPPLKYASLWGEAEASRCLAVQNSDREMGKLADKQTFKRFTIPADFGSAGKAPFHVFVRQWPPEYPFRGIDDQAEWLKQARGGTIPEEVLQSFRKLDVIARENDVSFPELCEYALSNATTKTETQQTGQSISIAANKTANPGLNTPSAEADHGCLYSTAHPGTNPGEAARISEKYYKAKREWERLRWWQRKVTKKPEPPPGIWG
jgi:tetratricopeptide (TPR) repeat protein